MQSSTDRRALAETEGRQMQDRRSLAVAKLKPITAGRPAEQRWYFCTPLWRGGCGFDVAGSARSLTGFGRHAAARLNHERSDVLVPVHLAARFRTLEPRSTVVRTAYEVYARRSDWGVSEIGGDRSGATMDGHLSVKTGHGRGAGLLR